MRNLRERWERFWFEPETPDNRLSLCRVLFYTLVLGLYFRDDLSAWGDVSHAFWFPLPLFLRLHLPVLSATGLAAADWAWKISLGASAIGLAT